MIDLTNKNANWLLDAENIGKITGRFPKQFSDELNELVDYIKLTRPDFIEQLNNYIHLLNIMIKIVFQLLRLCL